MKYKYIFLSASLILLFSCKKSDKQTIVGWKIIEEYPEEHLVIVDTIGKAPYNNSTLEYLLEIDSILKAREIKFLNDRQEFLLGEFEISLSENSSFNLSGQEMNFSKISIYHNDWPWNQIYFYSPEYGIVAEFHSHSRKKNMLVFMTIENDTVYKLGEQLLEYFENDSILNSIPPMPIEPSEIIEVFEQ
ncbi:hypothetical protein [Algoriphagus winogradskyi]|uniref:Lipocalin-like domain-containing protein n=1 Tax=Algoriphagus winogradskyi TaxID=237017 RepID=A0ABY1NB41_9BACT|nr:hypothetical protein [Algoriphagus winogradskyi]SMP05311.1 hypothetical protein SAMN06265367_101337 [Algoriphagus winogradskyi]